MKKYLILTIFCLFLSTSLFSMGRWYHDRPHGDNNNQPGGSGVPEPISLLLIAGGGAAAYGIKKAIKK